MAAPPFPIKAVSPAAVGDAPRSQVRLAAQERSAARARAFAARVLGKANPLTGTACLLVSELVTNAILHSRSCRPGGCVTVAICDARCAVRVEVTDDGSADRVPVLGGDPADTGGRGLVLVDALADNWGYRRTAASTTVWFLLAAASAGSDALADA